MSFVVRGEIHLDAQGAIQGVTVSKAQIESLGKAGKRAGDELAKIGPKVGGSGRSSQIAAGQVGNLAAQWNDLIVMMAAGQNPFQLAVQQGSQITQVIGPMGAAGAVAALKTSLLSLINPVSLVTYAAIAGGAAFVGWATSTAKAQDAASGLTDELSAVDEALKSYATSADVANMSNEELEERFGASGRALRTTLSILEDLAKSEAQNAIDGLAASLVDLLGVSGGGDRRTGIADFFDVNIMLAFTQAGREARQEARALTGEFLAAQDALTASNGSIDAQVIATERLLNAAIALADIDGKRNRDEEDLIRSIAEKHRRMLEVQGATDDQNQSQRRGLELAGMMRQQWEERAAFVAEETAELQKSGEMQRLIAVWGEDSVVVARARLQAERDAYAEMVKSEVGANGLAEELMVAWDAANGIAEVDASGNIIAAETATWSWADAMGGVAAQIEAIVGALASIGGGAVANAAKSAELEALKAGQTVQEAAVARQRAIKEAEWRAQERAVGGGVSGWFTRQRIDMERYQFDEGVELDAQIIEARKASRSASRRGGARAAEREARALNDLILRLQDELDATRESDPVKKEMLRYRDQLAVATDDQRRAVESLIEAQTREEEALQRQQEMWGFWSRFASTSIRDVDDALNMLLDSLLEASLTGGGPLGWIFGGQDSSGKGGLLGSVFGALFPKAASGGEVGEVAAGLILGQGGGRDDKKLILTSPGEYIVNARATARHRALLDQINYGTPSFAMGGAVSPTRPGASAPSGLPSGDRTFNINVNGTGAEEIRQGVHAAIETAFEHYDSEILAGRVRTIVNDRWTT